jgi:nucleoside-diphosphate-sugar epimerase
MDPTPEIVIVTGSGGFIGSAVIRRLARRFTPVGLDRQGVPCPAEAARCIDLDLTSGESVEAALDQLRGAYGNRIASVIHLAAYFDLTGEPNPKYEEVTVKGTERLLRALEGFEVEQFVFASSMLVHAPGNKGQPIDDEWPLGPKLPYRDSKVRTEKLIHEQHGDIPVVIASADATPGRVRQLRDHGAFDYLTKPLDLQSFLDAVDAAVAQRDATRGGAE